jgi:hypothetical protein
VKRTIDQLKRIERIRKRLADLSAWRLARLAHEREKLETTHEEMLNALGEGLMAFGAPSVAGTRRVRALELEMLAAHVRHKDLAARALDDGRLAKLAQGRLDTVRAAWQDTLDRKSLEELIDATIKPSGSRKP